MTLEQAVVSVVTILYGIVGISYALKGNLPWALVWFSYSMANVGLIWAASSHYR